ncbi:hypothetical protein Avbf_18982 [Armadillidium vulgare]|nr:hypothetical protein Avbf_18982 [Armadillidium vulgare]
MKAKTMILLLLLFILPLSLTSHIGEPVLTCYTQTEPQPPPWQSYNAPFLKNSGHSLIPQSIPQGHHPYGFDSPFQAKLETKETIIHHQKSKD